MNAVIAVVGCDGAGKSTLTADLVDRLGRQRPTRFVYLGQSSGNILAGVLRVPLVGPAAGRYLKRRSARAHADGAEPAAPDATTALVVHLLSRWRFLKFRRVWALARRGAVVVVDRYPQAEVDGFWFDGPGLAERDARGIVGWLARREAALYRRMAARVPALVIRLDIDAETAIARKDDHKPAMLREKVRVIPTLRFGGARLVALDGRDPYETVLREALRASRAVLGAAAASVDIRPVAA